MLFSKKTQIRPTLTLADSHALREAEIAALTARIEAAEAYKDKTIEKIAALLLQIHKIYPSGQDIGPSNRKNTELFIETMNQFSKINPKNIVASFPNDDEKNLAAALVWLCGKRKETVNLADEETKRIRIVYNILQANLPENPENLNDFCKSLRNEKLNTSLIKLKERSHTGSKQIRGHGYHRLG